MGESGKGIVWLTALTTVSLAVTGCHAQDHRETATAAASSRSARPGPPPQTATPRSIARHEPTVTTTPSLAAEVTSRPAPSVLVISDGSDVVRVGGRTVRFPVSVTDAVVSPNGVVLAFVDGPGNITTARLDGTGLRVLTTTDPGVLRAQPTFEDGGSEIVFSERGHDGVWRLKEVAADGHDDLASGRTDPTVAETEHDGGGDRAPSAVWTQPSHENAPRSVLLFEHRTSRGRVEVYVADRNQRGFGASRLLDGSSPAVSPAGDRVAFIAGGQIEVQALPLQTRRPHPARVTWRAHPSGGLAWSTDGRRIYFSTPRDVEWVSSSPVSPGRNPVHVALRHPGVASMGTVAEPAVGTFASADPVEAALAVTRATFVDGTSVPMEEGAANRAWADHVTLLSAADESAAVPAACIARGGPILFLPGGRLDNRVRAEVLRLMQRPHGFPPATVDIVGTLADVPHSVAADLRSAHLRVRRIDPADPADAAAGATGGVYDTFVVVSRYDLPTVVSSATTANPVLLTDGPTMPASTAARLDRLPHSPYDHPTVYAVGREAQAAVRSSWPGKRPFRIVDVGGQDSADDTLAALEGLYDSPGRLSVATADDWRSMLIAGMVGPVLVVGRTFTPAAREWLAVSQPVMRVVTVVGRASGLAGSVGEAVFGTRYIVRHEPTDITD